MAAAHRASLVHRNLEPNNRHQAASCHAALRETSESPYGLRDLLPDYRRTFGPLDSLELRYQIAQLSRRP